MAGGMAGGASSVLNRQAADLGAKVRAGLKQPGVAPAFQAMPQTIQAGPGYSGCRSKLELNI